MSEAALATDSQPVAGDELLVVEDLKKHFPVTRGIVFQKEIASVKAVDGVTFTGRAGETLGGVGESGCGKATMARCVMRLPDPTGGRGVFEGRHISDRVMVMYLGKVAELASRDNLYREPKHPYTGALLSAVPIPNPELGRARKPIVLQGDVPSPLNPPSACNFHPRCPRFQEGHCDVDPPPLYPFGDGHVAACHYPLEGWPLTEDEMRRPSSRPVSAPAEQSAEPTPTT